MEADKDGLAETGSDAGALRSRRPVSRERLSTSVGLAEGRVVEGPLGAGCRYGRRSNATRTR